MAIWHDKASKTFFLEGDAFSYVFKINEHGYLQHLHYGAKCAREDLSYSQVFHSRGFSPNFAGARGSQESLDTMPNEYPIFGNGDFRYSAILTNDDKGNRLENLKYKSFEILKGKPQIEGIPSLRGDDKTETLVVCLASLNLELKLYYSVYEKENALVRRATVKNINAKRLTVSQFCSMSIDLPDMDYEFLSLHGKHCGERSIERTPLRHGIQSVFSLRGASSHQHNPFVALVRKNTDEENGEVIAVNYVYSGNFEIRAECNQLNTVRLSAGFNPFDFSYQLKKNDLLESPETVLIYSSLGLGQASRSFHDLYRSYLIDPKFAYSPRPIVLNSWEGFYFDFNTEKLFDMIDNCKDLGIDVFVLDDGWFGIRNDDSSGLGDWNINLDKLQGGLDPIIQRCKQNGLKFGLWFEPEMINPDSNLYRTHPDWCIRIPNIEPALGRQQLVLDLSRDEVLDYVFKSVSEILSSHEISYVKWDMNRHITDSYSSKLAPENQQELNHRYMQGTYKLINMLITKFPNVLFEGCSGGGGRFDPAMLSYFPQYWTSDNSDAVARAKIQYGTSICYPISTMTGHVSVVPNHQTGRVASLKTRGIMAMNCIFGYELNPSMLTDEERQDIKKQTENYKRIEPLILKGDLYRLKSPFEGNDFAFLIVDKEKNNAVLSIMQILAEANAPTTILKLSGLNEHKLYHIEELNLTLSGKTLLSVGLPISQGWGDFNSKMFHICAVKQN